MIAARRLPCHVQRPVRNFHVRRPVKIVVEAAEAVDVKVAVKVAHKAVVADPAAEVAVAKASRKVAAVPVEVVHKVGADVPVAVPKVVARERRRAAAHPTLRAHVSVTASPIGLCAATVVRRAAIASAVRWLGRHRRS